MNVDVLIYINKLKEFFKKDEEAKNDIFGTIQLDEDKFYGMVEEKSNYNYKIAGEAILSHDEMLEIVSILINEHNIKKTYLPDLKGPFVYLKDGFLPICLN